MSLYFDSTTTILTIVLLIIVGVVAYVALRVRKSRGVKPAP